MDRTESVPFHEYVQVVMAGEWGPTHPPAALRAGAVAIKQYGWYHAMHWRGGIDAAGRCYDVVDSSVDQWYDPSRPLRAVQAEAVDDTWAITVRKDGRFFATGYRAGNGVCGAQEDGWHLLQHNASACAELGESTEALLRRYYGPDVSIVTTGANDLTGDGVGDSVASWSDSILGGTRLSVLTTDARMLVRLAASTGATTETGTGGTRPTTAIALRADEAKPGSVTPIGSSGTLGTASADVSGDGRSDLIRLLADGPTTVRVEIRRGMRGGFTSPATWWAGPRPASGGRANPVQLVVGDFDDGGRAQLGLAEIATPAMPGRFIVRLLTISPARRSASGGSTSSPARVIWRQSVGGSDPWVLAGDVSGDGSTDLIVLATTDRGSTSVAVAQSTGRDRFGGLHPMAVVPGARVETTPLVGDLNGDGRDDVVLLERDRLDRLSVVVLAARSGAFAVDTWSHGRPSFGWSNTRVAVSDLDHDGRADLVAYRWNAASGSTVVYRLMSTGSRFVAHRWRSLADVDWATFEVF